MIKAFLICHDTKTKFKMKTNKPIHQTLVQEHEYALNFCNIFGFEFSGQVKITQDKIPSYKIKYFNKFSEFYPILTINHITRARNRFSILVGEKYSQNQKEEDNKFTLYIWTRDISFILDTVVMPFSMKEKLKNNSQKLKEKGLQIMYYLKKELTEFEKTHFLNRKSIITTGLNNNPSDLDELYTEMERNAEFLIGAAYSSFLKPHVKETISDFQEARMKLYLISGDSEDNTMTVAFKYGIIESNSIIKKLIADSNETLFVMMKYIFNGFKKEIDERTCSFFGHVESGNGAKKSIMDFQNKNKFTLIINGSTLELIFQNRYLSNHFKFLLLLCSQFIGFEMNQIVNRELISMVKILFKSTTNDKIMVIGDSLSDLSLMQEAHIGIEINENMQSKIFRSDIVISGFTYLNNIIFIWSKISSEKYQKTINFLFFSFSLLTHLRFLTSLFSYSSQSGIIPRLFYFLMGKNIFIWILFDNFLTERLHKIILLKRTPLLYRQKKWQNEFELKNLVFEILFQPLLLALFIICMLEYETNNSKIKDIITYRTEIYSIITIVLFFQVYFSI